MRTTKVRLRQNYTIFLPFLIIPMLFLFHMIFPLITVPLRIYNPLQQTILFYLLVVFSSLLIFAFLLFDPFSKPKYMEINQQGLMTSDGQVIDRSDFNHVYFEGADMILMKDRKMTRTFRTIGSTSKLKRAFTSYGYPVSSRDPFIGEYQKWYRDHPDLTDYENGQIIEMIQLERDDWPTNAEVVRQTLRSMHGIYVKKPFKRHVWFRKAGKRG